MPVSMNYIYDIIVKKRKEPLIAVLIDPGKQNKFLVDKTLSICEQCKVGLILIGGSLVPNYPDEFIAYIKKKIKIPVVLFPGNLMQVSDKADAILLLSLISGRNPEYLIGNHVLAAPFIKKSKLEVIPTGYMLIESGKTTSVQYISNTQPIPSDKPDIAVATAMAGEMLGLKAIYLEAGSGAKSPVPTEIIEAVKNNVKIPIIVGGGIKTQSQFSIIKKATPNIIVIGNSIENNPGNLFKLLK
jgi:phosphoglycerol geranylgeranyltransferase